MANRLAARDLPLPPPARREPRRLVPVGRGGVRARARRGPRGARLDRLLRLPLVPRDGARVLRGRADRAAHERALRLHQGRPRGAPGRRRDLHGRGAGDDRRTAAGRSTPSSRPTASRSGPAPTSRPSRARACPPGRRCWRRSARRGTSSARRSARRPAASSSGCAARAALKPPEERDRPGLARRRRRRRCASSTTPSTAGSAARRSSRPPR